MSEQGNVQGFEYLANAKPEVNHAREQAITKVESIKEMMARLSHVEDCDGDIETCELAPDQLGLAQMDMDINEYHDADKAKEAIDESPLSVEVRSGWRSTDNPDAFEAEEYRILLCTGGPAVRIIGTLNYSVPDSARIEYQDWGTPWTEMRYGDFHERPNGTAWTNALADKYLEDAMAFDALLLSYARQFWYGE